MYFYHFNALLDKTRPHIYEEEPNVF